jgi:VCBS repeat-containing protein
MSPSVASRAQARIAALALVTLLAAVLPSSALAQTPSPEPVVPAGVSYPFRWVAPTRDVPFANRLTAGGVKAVRFSLGGNRGMDILAPGYPKSRQVDCRTGDVVPRSTFKTRPFGAAGLSYDRASRTYSYAWQTREGWSNLCRVFLLRLADGSRHRALFRIYTFHFNPPTRRLPVTNVWPAGGTVPIRFHMGASAGRDIFADRQPRSARIDCATGARTSDWVRTRPHGIKGLTYYRRGHNYRYAWRTSAAWTGTCRRFEMRLRDGTVQALLFRFGDPNHRPVAVDDGGAGFTTDEDTPFVTGNVLANDSDPDGDSLSVGSLFQAGLQGVLTERPGGRFRYVPATAFASLRSGETATDVFDYELRDGRGGTDRARVRIRVSGLNDAPRVPAASRSVSEGAGNGTNVGAPIPVNDPDTGDTHTFAITAGNTGGAFAIDASTGQLTVADDTQLDHQARPTYSLTVEVTDDGTPALSDSGVVTVDVNDVNRAPTLSGGPFSIPEDATNGTSVGTMAVTDPDAGQGHTFAIIGGNTGGAFAIDPTSGELSVLDQAQLDHEADPSFTLTVRVTDDGTPPLDDEDTVTISVSDVNEPPTDIALSDTSVAENQGNALVGTLSATDPDQPAQTFTFELVGGQGSADNGSFQIVGDELRTDGPLDLEAQASYSVRIRATDSGTPAQSFARAFTITATDANDAATDITLSPDSIAEDQPAGTTVGDLDAVDQDAADSHTFSLVSGSGDTDNGSFEVDGSQLRTAVSLTSPGSFSVRVQADDGNGGTFARALTVTVTDVNDAPVVDPASFSIAEDPASGAVVGSVTFSDPDAGQGHTFSIEGGNTGGAFAIGASSGQITVATPGAVDFETDPSFSLTVRVTDDGTPVLFDEATITVTVTDVNDAPTDIGLSNASVAENDPGAVVGSLSGVDQDLPAQALTFTLVAGSGDADNGLFQIAGTTLRLQGGISADFEADPSLQVRIAVDDGAGGSFEESFTISVSDANDAPTDITLTPDSIAEDQPSGSAVGTLDAVDQDPADSHTFSLVTGTGDTDNASFTIAGDQLLTATALDFETQASYSVRVQADDGNGGTFARALTITITDANDAPVAADTSSSTAEDTLVTITLAGTDLDDDVLTFQIPGTTDQGGALTNQGPVDCTGVTTCTTTIDYTPAAGFSGSDSFTFTVDDGLLTSPAATVSLTVTDANDAPDVTGPTAAATSEDTPLVFSDPNGNAISVSDPDLGGNLIQLTLTATSTVSLATTAGLDFAFSDADGTGAGDGTADATMTFRGTLGDVTAALAVVTYDPTPGFDGSGSLTVTANDLGSSGAGGSQTDTLTVTITVSAINDPPVNTVPGAQTVDEDTDLAFPGTIAVADPDAGGDPIAVDLDVVHGTLTLSTTIGLTFVDGTADGTGSVHVTGTLAAIDTALDGLVYRGAPDYDVTQGAETLTIITDDQGNTGAGGALTDTDTVAITVTPVNDAPTITLSASTPSYTEDGAPVTVDGGLLVADVDDTDLEAGSVTITAPITGDTLAFTPAGTGIVDGDPAPEVLALTGTTTLADWQSVLRSVTFSSTSVDPTDASRTLTFSVTDGDATSVPVQKSVAVVSVNDAPVNTVPVAPSIDEDTSLAFTAGNAISIADPDAGAGSLQVQLSVTHGTLTLATTTGLTVIGNATANVTATGTLTDLNNALATLSFTPTLDFPGSAASDTAAFSITTNDQGNTGTGGALSDTDGVTITVDQVNDAPTALADSFDTIGNTELRVDLTAGTTPAVTETTSGTFGVRSNDSDPAEGYPFIVTSIVGCPGGSPLSCTIASVGTVSATADGDFSFIPATTLPNGNPTNVTFQYVITDQPVVGVTPATATGTVTIHVFDKVWYVRQGASAGGTGTSADPLPSFSNIDSGDGGSNVDGAGDYIFVHDTGTALPSSIVLEANQHLLGEGVGLSIDRDLNGNGAPVALVTAGTQPAITSGANTISIGTAIPVEIRGLSIASTTPGPGNGIDLTSGAALTGAGTLTISNNTFAGASSEGIDVNMNAGTTGTLGLTISNNTWTGAVASHAGNAVDINRAAGTVNLAFSSNAGIRSNATAVNIVGAAVANATITAFADNSVSGDTSGAGITISNVTFDVTPGGTIQQVNGGTLAVGVTGNPVGQGGLSIGTSQGSVTFGDLDVFSASGTAVNVTGAGSGLTFGVTPTASGGSSTIDADNGVGLNANTVALDLRLADFDSNSGVGGLSLASLVGPSQFTAPSGSAIVSTGGTAFSVTGSNVALTYGGTINASGGPGVSMTGNNAAATFSFTGQLTLSTGGNAAFTATGGGTVTATASGSTLTATTANALNVTNTTIGAGGLTFQSISSSGGSSNGIILNNTGTAAGNGGLTVTGDGTNTSIGGNSSGGTIANKTGADLSFATLGTGIYLNNTRDVVLRRMTVNGTNENGGIRGTNVTNFTLEYSTVAGSNGTNFNSAPFNGGEGSVYFGDYAPTNGLNGTVTFTNDSISGGQWSNVQVIQSQGAPNVMTMTIRGSTFGANLNNGQGNHSLLVENRGTGTVNVTVGGTNVGDPNTFTAARADHMNFTGQNQSVMNVTVQNNTLTNDHPGNIIGGGNLTLATKGTMTFTVTGNSMRDANGSAVTLFKASADPSPPSTPTLTGTFSNNTIGASGVVDSGSETGNGIFVSAGGTGTMSFTIRNNQIHNIHGNAHIYADNTGGSYTANFTIEGNLLDGAQPPNWFAGIAVTNGSPTSSDTVNVCADIGGTAASEKNTLNLIAGSPATAQLGIIVGSSGAASGHTFRLPGLVTFTEAGVESFLAANNTPAGSFTVDAFADAPATFAAFTGTGTSCPTP